MAGVTTKDQDRHPCFLLTPNQAVGTRGSSGVDQCPPPPALGATVGLLNQEHGVSMEVDPVRGDTQHRPSTTNRRAYIERHVQKYLAVLDAQWEERLAMSLRDPQWVDEG